MNPVFQSILTSDEADKMLNFLDQLGQKIHKENIDVKNFIITQAPFHTSLHLVDYLAKDLDNKDSEGLKQKIVALQKELNSIPVVSLTVALTDETKVKQLLLQKGFEWIGKKVFFNIDVDPEIKGGAIVEGNGRIGKYTLKEYFKRRGNGL